MEVRFGIASNLIIHGDVDSLKEVSIGVRNVLFISYKYNTIH